MSGWKETDFGIIPNDWEVTTLGSICQLLTDGSHLSPKPVKSDYFMASVKDMRYNYFDFSDCKTISKDDFEDLVRNNCSPRQGDILLSKDGANCLDLIFVYRQTDRIVLLSSIAIARLKEGFNPDFYRYFLLSKNTQEMMRNNFVSGSAIPRVILKDFKNVPVPVLSIDLQDSIAEVLSSLDDKIDLLHRQNKTLEQLAETLFRQWCVEEAEESWESIPFQEFFDFLEGPGIRNWQYTTSGTPFINIRLIDNGEIDTSKANFVSNDEANGKYKHFMLNVDDMIVSTSGTLGKTAIVRDYHLPLMLNTSVIRFRPKDGKSYSFVYQYLKSRKFQEHLESAASGSVQSNFGPMHLKQMSLNRPPKERLHMFLDQADVFYAKLKKNYSQIRTLTQLRDTLLPKLMSGEVRVN